MLVAENITVFELNKFVLKSLGHVK